jgi:hypothetical protein
MSFKLTVALALVALAGLINVTAALKLTKADMAWIECEKPEDEHEADILSFEFDDCDAFPCPVKKGTNATGRVLYRSRTDAETMECAIYGIIDESGTEVPFPGGCRKEACLDLNPDEGGVCPIESREEYLYEIVMYIDEWFPSVS